MDLPIAWNLDDKSSYLSVDESGLRVNYEGLGKSDEDVGGIRTNHPIPPYCKLFYFEVDIIDEGENKIIGIGFCDKEFNLNRMPGWDDGSWGYHGDDGNLFSFSGRGNPYGPLFSTGDTIGCCLNLKNNTIFYTKNGISLGIAFRNLKGTLYPCVGLRSKGGSIKVNFGSRKFKFAATTSHDMGDDLLKNKLIDAFNMCINTTNIYTLEDLEISLKIKQDTAALKFRGKFNFIMGIYEDAIFDLTKLIDIEPKNKFALRYRGKAYYLMERYEDAIIDLTKLINIEPKNKFALRYRGEAYYLMERYKDAIIDLTKLIGIEPSDDVDELLKKKWIEAFNMCNNMTNTYTLEDLENSMKIKRDSSLKFRVNFSFIMGRYRGAIIDLTKLLDIEPNNKFALRYRGEAYYLMKKYKESFNDVKKLLNIETNNERASKLLAKIIEKDPCVDETYELGYFYLHGINVEKDEYKAFAQFEKSANMGHTEGINCLGYCYEHGIGIEKNENEAFIYYQKSAGMYNSNGMYQVGYCYYLGIGVDIDKHKAFAYYMKSAEAGNSMGIRKTSICYYYGIGVGKNVNKYNEWRHKDHYVDRGYKKSQNKKINLICHYVRIFSFALIISFSDRSSKDGKCAHCNEDNMYEAWCLSCDPDKTTRWASGNKDIDDIVKMFQLRTFAYEDTIEWIPFDRLSIVEEIGKGGFGSVYKATWLDGIRKVEKINDGNYIGARETPSIVALKTLSRGSLKEFENHMKCILNYSKLKLYRLTQNGKNEYLMVLQYADSGNLHKFLRTKFQEVTWKTKLKLLIDISSDLYYIYGAGYIHADFHSGNILQDQHISTTLQSYIADLGLSKKDDENDSEGEIYGVMPYVAPEVLLGQKFTKAADIYGFGVIMSEMSTGQRPFDGQKFDHILAVKICNGLRPEFAPGTPDFYIELANKCMDLDLKKRPNASEIWDMLHKWNKSMENSDDTSKIKKQFLDADKIVKKLPFNLPKHSEFIYTSKIINTKKVLIEFNASRSMDVVKMPNDL